MSAAELLELLKSRVSGASLEEATQAIVIPKESILAAASCLIDLKFDNLHCITAIDKKEGIELIYAFYAMDKHAGVTLKTKLSLTDLTVESLANLWKSADWLEREVYDLFGVKFTNHPNLIRILNPDDWEVHPLRKDFERPDFVKKPRY